jgi:hypothetical protein
VKEQGMGKNAINHLVSSHRSEISPTFEEKPTLAGMNRKTPRKKSLKNCFKRIKNSGHRLEPEFDESKKI